MPSNFAISNMCPSTTYASSHAGEKSFQNGFLQVLNNLGEKWNLLNATISFKYIGEFLIRLTFSEKDFSGSFSSSMQLVRDFIIPLKLITKIKNILLMQ